MTILYNMLYLKSWRFRILFVALHAWVSLASAPLFAQQRDGDANPQASPSLSLDEIIDLVKANNAVLKQARLQTSRAEEQVAAARTKTKPQVGMYLLGSHQIDKPEIYVERGFLGEFPKLGAFPATGVTFTESRRNSLYSLVAVTYPITQQRDISTGIRMSETTREIAEARETQASLDVLCETKKLYCAILALENAQTANQSAVRLFSNYCSTIERLAAEGYAQKADLFDVKARLAQVEARAESIKLKRTSLLETLSRLCGLGGSDSLCLAALPEPGDDVTSGCLDVDSALTDHPLIRGARLQKKLANLDRELAKGEFRPNLTLTVDRLQGHRTAEYLPKQMSSAGLLVSWNPFDWGKRKHELDSRQMACRQSEIALAETDKTVREVIRAAQRRVQETRAQLAAVRKKCDWAEEQARVFRNRLSEKAVLPKDLLEAEAQLAEANFLRHQACLDVWVAQAELEKALGDEL